MKDENAFNSWLSSKLKKRKPDIVSKKIADKYKRGISDFLLWGYGTSVILECKFIADYPKTPSAKALKHDFSPEQMNYMREIERTGNKCFGLVYVDSRRLAHLLPYEILRAAHEQTLTSEILQTNGYIITKTEEGVDFLLDIVFGR